MSTLSIILSIVIFILSSIYVIRFSIKEFEYLKDDSMIEYIWYIIMNHIIICGMGVGLFVCVPILLYL